jgi:Flp pilus assembly protein TadD
VSAGSRPEHHRRVHQARSAAARVAPPPSRGSHVGWRTASAIFAIALAVRLVHIWQIRKAPFFTILMGDSRAYDEWAQQIARGDWLGHEVFYQAPLYPYLLGTFYAIAGRDLLMVRVGQAIIGSVSCVLLGLAGCRLFSRRAGVIAGLGLALYAPAIFFDALVQKSVLDAFFVCLVVWLLARLITGPQTRWAWFWTGVAMGGLSLTRENALVFVGVTLLWALARRHVPPEGGIRNTAAAAGWRTRIAAAGMFVLGLTSVLLPVAARNSVVGGGFYLTTSQFGPNFYIGNNARADGTYMSLRFGRGAPEYEREDATALAEAATGRHLSPAEVSSYWTKRALAFIRSDPLAWLKLLGRKFALLWNRSEMLDTESQETHAEWSTPLRLGGRLGHFGVVVPLALLGLLVTWPLRDRLWVIYGIAAAYAASVVMFYVFARYRYPLVPFLLLFAAAGLVELPRVLRADARTSTLVAAVLAAAVFVNRPMLDTELMRAITEQNLGAALQSDNRFDEAIEHYRRAVAFKADYAPAYANMGAALRAEGRLSDAVAAYEHALALRPDEGEAHYNLANALQDQGKPGEAIEHFRRALRLTPDSADVHNNLGIALAATGRSGEAVTEFREAVRLDPGSSRAHRNLGDALASQGMRAEAIEQLRRAVGLDPRDGEAQYDLGSVLLEAGRFAEAADRFRTALQLMPDSPEAHNDLGIALASLGEIEGAIDQFQQALEIQPAFADAQQNLAKLRSLR